MGEISGDYPTTNYLKAVHAETWRVSLDGELRDRFDGLTKVFECDTEEFSRDTQLSVNRMAIHQ